MKVLHATSNIDPLSGGPARALLGLVLAQKKAGIDCVVLSTWQGELDRSFFKQLRQAQIPVALVGPCRAPLKRHRDLYPAVSLAMRGCDIVHIHALWEEVQHAAAQFARAKKIPYIFRPCGMLDPWSMEQRGFQKKLYLALRLKSDLRKAAAMHFTSDEEKENAEKYHLANRALVLENGLSLDEFETMPSAGLFRRAFPQIAARKIILALSRIHPKKGFDLLIPAFARAKLDNCVLVISGADDVNFTPTIREYIRNEGVGDRVVLTGALNTRQRLEALSDADLFVLPSYQENFGIAVVEAAAAGVPVIISDKVGIHDLITQAGAGDSVTLSVDAIASKLRIWMNDEARRREAGANGKDLAFSRFDWNAIAVHWKQAYESLIAESRSN